MIRFLRIAKGSKFFFKNFRIGLRLVSASFKSIFFEHSQYIFFCLILVALQFGHLWVNTIINPTISFGTLLSELLANQNIFEILFKSHRLFLKIELFRIEVFIYYLKTVFELFTFVACAYHVQDILNNQKLSIAKSFKKSLSKYKTVIVWSAFEIAILFISTSLGIWGNIVYFSWQLITAFYIQIIAFQKANIFKILQNSIIKFRQRWSNVISMDLLFNLSIIFLIGLCMYLFNFPLAQTLTSLTSQNTIFFLLIFYLLAALSIAEVIAMTVLYNYFNKHSQ